MVVSYGNKKMACLCIIPWGTEKDLKVVWGLVSRQDLNGSRLDLTSLVKLDSRKN